MDRTHPGAVVIGSDQLASLEGEVFGKPGDKQNAIRQLQRIRGQRLDFYTGLCLRNGDSGRQQLDCVHYTVRFRNFTDEEIERYVELEQPYNCAAAFKSEALGISLVAEMLGPDPSALIGLPLISLGAMLRNEGFKIP